jgi:hypothetical protein
VYPLRYKGDYITSYFADIVVDGKIILELKAVKAPRDAEAEGKKWGLAVTRTRPKALLEAYDTRMIECDFK